MKLLLLGYNLFVALTNTLYDEPNGRIAIDYVAADTVTALAFCQMDELPAWLKVSG